MEPSLNMVLKQGGNKFHGSGWWYFQRSATDATDYLQQLVRSRITCAISTDSLWADRSQKNKTFFFVDFEKSRQQDPINIEGVVPTDLERAGDFSQSLDSTPGGIFDPSTCVLANQTDQTCTRPQFSGNKIPASEIDPVGQAILNLYPHAKHSGRHVSRSQFPDRGSDVRSGMAV